MSRIGNAPVTIPKGVAVKTTGRTISVKGPKGELSFEVPHRISFTLENDVLKFTRATNSRTDRALHGTARARTARFRRDNARRS